MLARLAADRPELGTPIPEERFQEAVNVILSYQNSDGGMATYENTRSFHALEVSRALSDLLILTCMICYVCDSMLRDHAQLKLLEWNLIHLDLIHVQY